MVSQSSAAKLNSGFCGVLAPPSGPPFAHWRDAWRSEANNQVRQRAHSTATHAEDDRWTRKALSPSFCINLQRPTRLRRNVDKLFLQMSTSQKLRRETTKSVSLLASPTQTYQPCSHECQIWHGPQFSSNSRNLPVGLQYVCGQCECSFGYRVLSH